MQRHSGQHCQLLKGLIAPICWEKKLVCIGRVVSPASEPVSGILSPPHSERQPPVAPLHSIGPRGGHKSHTSFGLLTEWGNRSSTPELARTTTQFLLLPAQAWFLHPPVRPAYGVSLITPTSAPLRPSPGFASSSTTSPCPLSPSPSYCEVRILCLRHLGLLPWKQGRIKAGARSAGIRPLSYLSSRLSRLPQGSCSQPQAPWLVSLPARARDRVRGRGSRRCAATLPDLGGERGRRRGRGAGGGACGLTRGHLPSRSPGGSSPRGSHVGARRDFPSARANFAALCYEAGSPRVVVRGSPDELSSG